MCTAHGGFLLSLHFAAGFSSRQSAKHGLTSPLYSQMRLPAQALCLQGADGREISPQNTDSPHRCTPECVCRHRLCALAAGGVAAAVAAAAAAVGVAAAAAAEQEEQNDENDDPAAVVTFKASTVHKSSTP